jgi:UDP-GlcNAc:undecaprenyl-phosphate/decaprenyl-phosphate GlcNAc-1-phosphate transferase
MPSAVSAFVLAVILSLILTLVCRLVATRLGCVDAPRHDRWHRRPTALFGGVAIVLTVTALASIFHVASSFPWLLVAGAGIFTVGLIDDVVSLKPSTKLVAEIALASGLVFGGYRLEWTQSLTLDAILTFAWIVGITNAFNLLDNMDGLSAGVAMIAGVALLGDAAGRPGAEVNAVYLAILLGATAGFLFYNLNPASIFLGDCGSLFLGLNLAVLTLSVDRAGAGRANVFWIVVGPVLMLLIPIFDTTLVTIARWRSGRRASQGGRDHSSHRLVAIGLSERAAVAVLWTLAALGGVIAFAGRRFGTDWAGLATAVFVLAMVIFAAYLAQVRVYEDRDAATAADANLTALVVDFMYKRRVAQVLLDACLVTIAYYAAYRLRFETDGWSNNFEYFLKSFPLAIGIQIVALFGLRAYRGVWRHFGLMDAVVLVKGVLVGTIALIVALVLLYRFAGFSRALFVIYATLLTLLMIASRASFRLMTEFVARRQERGLRVIIYGTGTSGVATIRSLLDARLGSTRFLGFIDDDPSRQGTSLQGYPVLGGHDALVALLRSGSVDAIIVSDDALDAHRLEQLEVLCFEHGVALSRLRIGLEELVASQ